MRKDRLCREMKRVILEVSRRYQEVSEIPSVCPPRVEVMYSDHSMTLSFSICFGAMQSSASLCASKEYLAEFISIHDRLWERIHYIFFLGLMEFWTRGDVILVFRKYYDIYCRSKGLLFVEDESVRRMASLMEQEKLRWGKKHGRKRRRG